MPQSSVRTDNGVDTASPAAGTWRVSTGARLHFGLFAPGTCGERAFGGVGLMIDEPRTMISARRAAEFSATGPHAQLIAACVARLEEAFARSAPPLAWTIHALPPRHSGLGSGTQLALSVGEILASAWGVSPVVPQLAAATGRGRRSAIGLHGYAQGGLLIDAGKNSAETIAPLTGRAELPGSWRIVLVWPHAADAANPCEADNRSPGEVSIAATSNAVRELSGVSGERELAAFAALPPIATELHAQLRAEALEVLFPAAATGDFAAFSASVFRYNQLAGECFAPVQGGVYASAAIANTVALIVSLGIAGVGQSSWGPVVFAFCETEPAAARLIEQLNAQTSSPVPQRILITRPRNGGRQWSELA